MTEWLLGFHHDIYQRPGLTSQNPTHFLLRGRQCIFYVHRYSPRVQFDLALSTYAGTTFIRERYQAVGQRDEDLEVTLAVLDDRKSDYYFGVRLVRQDIQPVWLKLNNLGQHFYRLRVASIDANYYPPLEAAYVNHFRIGHRILEFGILAWLFLPLLIILPFKLPVGPMSLTVNCLESSFRVMANGPLNLSQRQGFRQRY